MPKYTFQARLIKVGKFKTEADTLEEAKKKAEERYERFIEEEDYRACEPEKIWIHGRPGDYPESTPWSVKRE